MRSFMCLALCAMVWVPVAPAAEDPDASGSRLLATGGATQLEGAAGGGIVPWAVISGYDDEGGGIGGTAAITHVALPDYSFTMVGATVSWDNRYELSFARQEFDLGTLGDLLALPDARLRQHVFGLKVRLYGDLLYEGWPQISLGLQYKDNLDPTIPFVAGARDDSSVDAYLSASRVLLGAVGGRNLLLSGTLRSTEANQLGLLGFGGDLGGRELVFEGSAALLLDRDVAVGLEYRQKPDNLSFAGEDDWTDLFVAWFPNRNISLVAAYADLGSIGGLDGQSGLYFNVQGSF